MCVMRVVSGLQNKLSTLFIGALGRKETCRVLCLERETFSGDGGLLETPIGIVGNLIVHYTFNIITTAYGIQSSVAPGVDENMRNHVQDGLANAEAVLVK